MPHGWQEKRFMRLIKDRKLDFGYLMAVSKAKLPTVIMFRLENESPENVNRRLEEALTECCSAAERGVIITILEHTHRVRVLPI